jgi:hypothetical protein
MKTINFELIYIKVVKWNKWDQSYQMKLKIQYLLQVYLRIH